MTAEKVSAKAAEAKPMPAQASGAGAKSWTITPSIGSPPMLTVTPL